ncbi:MAG: hypothetical protein AAF333_01490 [Planctomycetota bacterium]
MRRSAGGFTLIEAALTMVIVGTGVLAMVSAQQAYHIKNDWAQRTGTAQMLANEIRELTLVMPHHDPITGSDTLGVESNEIVGGSADPEADVVNYDDLDDFTGGGGAVTFSPPINGLRLPIADLDQWAQEVSVENVLPESLGGAAYPIGSTDMMRVTVTVTYQSPQMAAPEDVTSMTWVVSR